jgi:hypothetical protein
MSGKTGAVVIVLLVLATGAAAADLPPAGTNILGWPRMTSPAFGCLLEKTFGHRDARFNCSLPSVNAGDACTDTDNYYAGPKFPPALITRIHTLASDVSLAFEHGRLQAVTVTLTGKFGESAMRQAFGLPPASGQPENIVSVSVQDCSLTSTCLILTGFDHMGAADVECPTKPSKKTMQLPK